MIENTTEPVEEIGLHQPEKQRLMTEYPSVNRSIRATMNTPFGIDISQIPMRPNVKERYEGQQYSVLNEPAAKGLIKEFEGVRLDAYQNKGDVPTIGYGSTYYPDGSPVKMGDTVTEPEANELFDTTFKGVHKKLSNIPAFRALNPNAQAGIISFAYNLGQNFYGTEGFETISAAIDSGDLNKIADAMQLYYRSDNPENEPGLQRRRRAEGDLVLSDWGPPPVDN